MAFRKAKERQISVRALTDPKPAFVSIVKAGANQVPFRSLKADAAPEETNMSERIKAMRAQGMEIARIKFERGEAFADIDAVKAWLDDGGYTYAEVAEKDDCFEIENAEATFEDGTVVEIDAGNIGVTIWVGKLDAESAAKAEGEGGDEPRGKVVSVEVEEQKAEGGEAVEETRTGKGDVADAEADTETAEKEGEGEGNPAEQESEKQDNKSDAEDTENKDEPATPVQKNEHDGEIETMVRESLARKSRLYASEEMHQRFDDFMAHFSEALTLGGVMSDGDDGIPPGFGEGIQAMVVAMRNNLMAGDTSGARAVAVDFGDLVVALVNAMQSVQDEVQRTERCQRVIDLFKQTLPGQGAEDETSGDGDGGTVLKAIADLAATIEANQVKTEAAISEVTHRVEATEKKVAETEAGLSERVKELEGKGQTRKSADATDEGTSTGATRKGPIHGLALRSALGMSNPTTKESGF